MSTDSITTFPIYRDGYPFTIREVHTGDLLGMVTLRGEGGEVTVAASEVPRRLYGVRIIHPVAGPLGLVTGSYGQTLSLTWAECEEMIESFKRANVSAPGTEYRIEVNL